jgi:C-terminal processing protease CtpA/Prc
VFGYRPKFNINFIDSTGKAAMAGVSIYSPVPDTTEPRAGTELPEVHRVPRRVRKKWELFSTRNITFDTSLSTAFMSLNTFQKSGKLRRFFRKSFRKSESLKIKNLVIDLRTNGGGNVTNSNLLTKYIADRPFKIADSLYTRNRSSQYSRYQQNHLGNWLFALFLTRKRADGNYHFGYYERKHFKPKRKNHFNGQVYVLSGGNTFSASTLFIKSVGQQKNVVVVGEETGGGAYGNNAWLIPNVTLPVTKVRFRLPLYRLVIDKNETKGFGVQPGVEAPPTVEAIKKNLDFKMNKAVELIRSNRQ